LSIVNGDLVRAQGTAIAYYGGHNDEHRRGPTVLLCKEEWLMSVLHVKYLLVGGGVASSAAAAAIRELDTEGDLLLVGQEINRPYRRPPLCREFLRGQMPREELFVQPAG
jgi:hypothetical protein